MDELYPDTYQFIEQQIELYGDELVFDKSSFDYQTDEYAVDNSLQWQSCESLAALEEQICQCSKCALHKSRNKFIFGKGNQDADLMLVGEAPGADEDRLGEPFVGRAGELLTKMLAAIDIKRDSVYIANILKCRPPQNRDPLPEEIALCKAYLIKQIQLIKPKIIVCLGRIASHALLARSDSLSAMRGQTFDFEATKLVVTYHPAALLRNTSLKRDAWEDLQRIQRLLINNIQ